MALVIISGRGSDLDYVALSKEDFVRLTEESADSDTIEDLLDSSDTESGPINGYCELYVDGEQIQAIELPETDEIDNPLSRIEADYFLIKDVAGKGYWKQQEIENFDKDKLEFSLRRIGLPNGVINDYIDVYYDGEMIEFGFTEPNYEDIYILDKEGNRYEINMEEEDEDEEEYEDKDDGRG